MKKSYLLSIVIFQCTYLSSCLGGSDYYRDRVEPFLKNLKSSYRPQVFDGVMEPEFPDLEEDQKTLVGNDSNHDGVRDDMEIFINRNFNYDFERENFKMQFKRSLKFFESYRNMPTDEMIRYDSNSFEDDSCTKYAYRVLKKIPSDEVMKYQEGEALYNTRKRSDAYNFNYQKLAGRAYGDGYGDHNIFLNCKKRIDEKYNLKE